MQIAIERVLQPLPLNLHVVAAARQVAFHKYPDKGSMTSSVFAGASSVKPPGGRDLKRCKLRVRALVAGLAPSVLPMLIRDITEGEIFIEFDCHAAAIDELHH